MLLLRNALVFDGSGNPAFPGSILVSEGRVHAVFHAESGNSLGTISQLDEVDLESEVEDADHESRATKEL